MSDLTEFLLARVAEDQAVARSAETDPRHSWVFVDFGGNANADHGRRWNPARVLAECEAKRRIIRGAIPGRIVRPDGEVLSLMAPNELARADLLHEWILRVLAQPYADHPDFREEWKQ